MAINLAFPDSTYTASALPSVETLKSDLSQIENDVNNHETDTSNPHSVTAAQVGAYTTAEADAAFATPSDLSTHESDTSTHGVTTIAGLDEAQTLTNKRINPRVGTVASDTTPNPEGDNHDHFTITALAGAISTFTNPTGTPVDGQKLVIRIKDNGTARTISWGTAYRAGTDVPLPTTTVLGKTIYCGFMYNSADSKWDLLAVTDNI